MTKVLITGATGNVGKEVLISLQKIKHQLQLFAGIRDITATDLGPVNNNVRLINFDFTDLTTFEPALTECDILFLLRPPQISDVEKYFKPIIDTCIQKNVKHIVFFSVQGVEKSKIIPHHKIEKLIVHSKIPYTFLRPTYFMQNFTTTLHNDLVNFKQIYLPAGKAKFTLIDLRNVGEVAANVLANISQHINQAYDLTNYEKLTFSEMANIISKGLGFEIKFVSPNLLRFFIAKRKEGTPVMLILVMIMLHYFPRFQKEPETSNWVEKITNKPPITFEKFILDNKIALSK
jgi:uncharacterized protein YbjT (DUF2867 family)